MAESGGKRGGIMRTRNPRSGEKPPQWDDPLGGSKKGMETKLHTPDKHKTHKINF